MRADLSGFPEQAGRVASAPRVVSGFPEQAGRVASAPCEVSGFPEQASHVARARLAGRLLVWR